MIFVKPEMITLTEHRFYIITRELSSEKHLTYGNPVEQTYIKRLTVFAVTRNNRCLRYPYRNCKIDPAEIIFARFYEVISNRLEKR